VAYGAGGPERRRLDDILDRQPRLAAVTEQFLDPPRLIVQAEDHFVDLGHLLQQVELIVEKRSIEDRNNRFRRVNGERTEARAFAPREEDRLHGQPAML